MVVALHPGDGTGASCWSRTTTATRSSSRELLAEVDPGVRADRRRVASTRSSRGGELERYDCVLLDLDLPGTHGLDGLRAILRADGGRGGAAC